MNVFREKLKRKKKKRDYISVMNEENNLHATTIFQQDCCVFNLPHFLLCSFSVLYISTHTGKLSLKNLSDADQGNSLSRD